VFAELDLSQFTANSPLRFVMPVNYTMESLPKPNNAAVKLEEIPGRRYAVIRFSGMSGEKSLRKNTEELTSFISGKILMQYQHQPTHFTIRLGYCHSYVAMKWWSRLPSNQVLLILSP